MVGIAEAPDTLGRKLRSMPEGVDRLVDALLGLRDALEAGRWDLPSGERLAALLGTRWAVAPKPPARILTDSALGGDPAAREALLALIDEEVEALLDHRETFDLEAIDDDRAGASGRAIFDAGKAATLARRYEAAAERGVYRALRELREIEAGAEPPREVPTAPPMPGPGSPPEPLGSFRAGPPPAPEPDSPPDTYVRSDALKRRLQGPSATPGPAAPLLGPIPTAGSAMIHAG